ncbi:MAG: response regulator [Gammaproteobacteria bacterium]|nr:MAG: response regulator [Gammaproteobacteria bacterium]
MDSSLPVLVVDDARFSRAIITRSLTEAGFKDVRFAESGLAAVRMLEDRPADIVISDWVMPEMDGLELTRRIRDMDEILDHFTYVMLLSSQEEMGAISRAFEHGVDDFISKAALRTYLLPRVWAACRTAGYNNGLLASNRQLREQIATLERRNMVDALTGLGNERFTDRALSDLLRQVASRGGAACVILIALHNYTELAASLEPGDVNRIVRAAASRLEHLVRPMDVVTRPRPDTFAVLVHQPSVEHCTCDSFRRILVALDGHKLETAAGVQRLQVAMSVCAAHGPDGIPTPDELLAFARERLREAAQKGEATDGIWQQKESEPS